MTLKRVQQDDVGAEHHYSVGRPYIATPPGEEDEMGSDPGSEWSEDKDVRMTDTPALSSKDVVIAIMGVTGAGKSRFISQLTDEEVEVGHHLQSSNPEAIPIPTMAKPSASSSFDDTNRSDTDILKDIAFFLSTIYTKKVKLAGIIYLHRITDVRMTGSSYKNLQMLEKLCGDSALSKVVLASTMWNLLGRPGSDHTLEVGEQREAMLKGKFWGSMESKGSLVTRHYGDAASGQAIASRLLSNESAVVLDIQREMVDEGLSLDRTAAGMFLQSDHLKLRQKYERELLDAQEALEDALKEKDSELAAQFAKQRDDCQSALLRADADQSSLRVDLSSLLAEKDAHYASLAAEMAKEKKARETEARFIEQNLADLRDALDKQEQDHKEEMNRMRRSQNTKTAVEQERVAQLAAQYERRHADMMAQIAAVEEERRRKAARGLGRLVSSGFQSFLDFFGVGDAEPYYEPRRRELRKGEMRQYHGGTGGDGGWGRQRNAYYDR